MTQQTDFRVLCAELTDELSGYASANPHHDSDALVIRARAALAAEPVVAPAEPTDEAAVEAAAELIYMEAMEWAARQSIPSGHINIPAWQQGGNSDAQEVARRTARAALAAKPLVKGPTDEEIERRFQVWWYDEGSGMPPGADEDPEAHVHRISQIAWHNGAYVARYGHQPAPPAGKLLKEAAWLRNECSAENADGNWISMSIDQALDLASLLERQAAPAPATGEVAELVAWLRGSNWNSKRQTLATRAADLLEQRHPAPVPVSEHPWKRDWWCDDEDRCWCFNQWDLQWELECYTTGAHWCDWMLPATALPLPQGEVQP